MKKTLHHKSSRYGVLDGLRGLAILLVVWFHLWQQSWLAPRFKLLDTRFDFEWIPVFGFLGVDLFFFLSGFCLMLPFVGQSKRLTLQNFDFKSFYSKRALKILPSFWLSLVLISIYLYLNDKLPEPFYKHLLVHLLFIQNWFSETYGSINGVFWSLAVEVQFYFFFPLICILFLRRPKSTFFVGVFIAAASRYLVATQYEHSNTHLINQLPCVLDLFLLGMTSSYIFSKFNFKNVKQIHFTMLALASAVFLVLLYQSANTYRYHLDLLREWQLKTRFWFGLGFSVLTVASLKSHLAWKKLFSNRLLIFFSIISYNLYIWHQFIAVFLTQNHIPKPATLDPHSDPNWAFPYFFLALGTGVLFSWMVTKFIEQPILKWGKNPS